MGDNHHVYRRISQGLRQLYPKQMTGHQARHMNTLAGMVGGIVRSGKCHMKAMAKKSPDRSKVNCYCPCKKSRVAAINRVAAFQM